MIEQHGGNIFGCEILHDFSANLNPMGMPYSVKNALLSSVESWQNYPDPFCTELRKKLSCEYNTDSDKIVCGNGAADLICRIAGALKPKTALITVPTFSEYEKALKENGCEVLRHQLSEESDFLLDESIISKLDQKPDMLILCTPNNPTGRTVSSALLEKICRICSQNDILFLCDECFMDFTGFGMKKSALKYINSNVMILRAFTKIYAMAGLRLGYCIFGDKTAARKVSEYGQFWSVSAPAQTAGIAALDEKNWISQTVELISEERQYLERNLNDIGIKVYPSDANFILLHTDIDIQKLLMEEKILIRNCSNYIGLGEGYYRIAVRSHDENAVLIKALRRCLNGKKS